jgi:segregation and condensation protein B
MIDDTSPKPELPPTAADAPAPSPPRDPLPEIAAASEELSALPASDEIAEAQGRAQLLRRLEALLFAAAAPLSLAEIARRMPDAAPVEELIEVLEAHYAGRGVQVVRVAGMVTLRTAPDLAGTLDLEVPVTRKPSRAAVETLAIIAYQQAEKKPVTRAEIEEIRGVATSKGTLDQLMEAGWIRPHGHRENVPGRPVEWVTTDGFLIHFGLDSLRDLPGLEELRAAGLLDRRAGVSQYGEQGALELPPAIGDAEDAEEGPVVDDDARREAAASPSGSEG